MTKEELRDPFDGSSDLREGVIRCVGDADRRFEEDALRVMRAMRFASTYGFSISPETAEAVHHHAGELSYVARERIFSELRRMLQGDAAEDILLRYPDVMSVIIPELGACVGFDQHNPYHSHTVYEHIACAVGAYKGRDSTIKLALLLHDIGKPLCYTENETGGHFYDHARISRDLTKNVLDRFRADNRTRHDVAELVLFHDAEIRPVTKSVRKWLSRIGEEQLRRLLKVRKADVLAHSEKSRQEYLDECDEVQEVLEQVLAQEPCLTLKELAISGRDLIGLGVPEGKEIGRILALLLERVIAGELSNDHGVLTEASVECIHTLPTDRN